MQNTSRVQSDSLYPQDSRMKVWAGHAVWLAPSGIGGPRTLPGTCSLVITGSGAEGSGVRISQTPQVALGRAIRLRREEVGLTQEALADAADLDATSIRGLERGVANPTWDVVDRVSRVLGLALHELARRADELETQDRRPTNAPLRPDSA
jgi:DNA-binding XRE family transcriptional regulator